MDVEDNYEHLKILYILEKNFINISTSKIFLIIRDIDLVRSYLFGKTQIVSSGKSNTRPLKNS